MTAINLASNFNAAPLGPFTNASKLLAWPGAIIDNDADPSGTFFEIVTGGRFGDQCCRMKYPANSVGENSHFYTIPLGAPGVPVVYEMDWLFEPNFDMSHGPGKIAPMLIWGGRSGANGGTDSFVVWESAITTGPKRFNPAVQNQQNPSSFPSNFIAPYYTKNIVPGVWNHWRVETMGGPSGYGAFELDGVKLATVPVPGAGMGNTLATNSVKLEVGYWAGGGAGSGPQVDSFARHDNLRVYTADQPSFINVNACNIGAI